MMLWRKCFVVPLLLLTAGGLADAQQQLSASDINIVYFTDLAETHGGGTSVANEPQKDPLAIRPRLVMTVKPVKTVDDLYVVAVGFLAWRDATNQNAVTFQIQNFLSPRPIPATTPLSEIHELRRQVLLTKGLGPDDRYPLKEPEPFGLGDLVARLGKVERR